MRQITLRYRKKLKYTIGEYDRLLCFLAAESESEISFSPTRLDFAAHEVTIKIYFLETRGQLSYL